MDDMRVGTKRLGYRGSQDHGHTLQGSVLTNQCLGKGTNVERGAEESFVTDRDKLIVETLGPESRRHWGHINDIISRLWLRHDDKNMRHDGRGLELILTSQVSERAKCQ